MYLQWISFVLFHFLKCIYGQQWEKSSILFHIYNLNYIQKSLCTANDSPTCGETENFCSTYDPFTDCVNEYCMPATYPGWYVFSFWSKLLTKHLKIQNLAVQYN